MASTDTRKKWRNPIMEPTLNNTGFMFKVLDDYARDFIRFSGETDGPVLEIGCAFGNVTIPAHYHGSIVGVTLALMGVCYLLLPKLGYPLRSIKMAIWQPVIYSTGQLMHVGGLVWSGGYGVQRKVAGAQQSLDSIERVLGMGLMGFGGLVSSIGGLLFLIIVLRALTRTGQPVQH